MKSVFDTVDYTKTNIPKSNFGEFLKLEHEEKSDTNFQLNIPHRSLIDQQQQHTISSQRVRILSDQKRLIEEGFEKLNEEHTSIEFDTEQPLLPEITSELCKKGYNYYYQYKCSNGINYCHVIISTKSLGFIDPFHHNKSLYDFTRHLENSGKRFSQLFESLYYRPIL